MSHHLSGLGLHPLSMDARSHLTDLYAFQKPGDPSKTVLIIDVNPLSPTSDNAVDDQSVYEVRIDTDSDAVADRTFRVRFSPVMDGTQTATVQVANGRDGADGQTIIRDARVSLGATPEIVAEGDYRFFAGLRSDPFFADAEGAGNNFQWTGRDTFADKNVFAIILRSPTARWARIRRSASGEESWSRHDGQVVQGDRIGRPAIDFAFNQNDDDKRTYNLREPHGDRELFLDKFAHVLEHVGHYPGDEAKAIAGNLLPDMLTYDYSKPSEYPNGRGLTDDVLNMGLAIMTNGALPSDGLRPHTDLLPDFPYLGRPH
jgi:hypothetical protein